MIGNPWSLRFIPFSVFHLHAATILEYILISKGQFSKRLEGRVISLSVRGSQVWLSLA